MSKPNTLDNAGKKSMKTRIITAAVLIILGGGSMFLGSYFWLGFIALCLGFATYEFINVTGKKYSWYIYLLTYVVTFVYFLWPILKGNMLTWMNGTCSLKLEQYVSSLVFFFPCALVALFLYFCASILHENFGFSDVTYFFTMSLLVGVGFQALTYLRFYPVNLGSSVLGPGEELGNGFKYLTSAMLIVFATLGAYLNDAFAYFTGIFFGKHKINPRVSPKKTFEGFFGGWFLSFVFTFGFGMLCSATKRALLPGVFDLSHWYNIALVAFVIPLIANLGDFSFSLVKRHYGIKDYGKIIVGHGGVLDRADSLIFTSLGLAVAIWALRILEIIF